MKNLYASLIKVQAEVPVACKDSKVSFGSTKYSYAPLENCQQTLYPILAKHDLGIIQLLQSEDNQNFLITRLIHTSGEQIESKFNLGEFSNANSKLVQNFASVLTYIKRYALNAITGLITDDDYDAMDMVKIDTPVNSTSLVLRGEDMKHYNFQPLVNKINDPKKARSFLDFLIKVKHNKITDLFSAMQKDINL